MRASGILLPVSSLPSKYGIGTFSKQAYQFVDILEAAGQKYWQILPLGPTGYGDSPYQSFSTFAGNPYYIDLEDLIQKGYITKQECDACDFGDNDRYIDYEKIYLARFDILKKAYQASDIAKNVDFNHFIKNNDFWLNDYSHYMAIKNHFKGISWIQWDEDIRHRKSEAVKVYSEELHEEVEFYQFLQYIFNNQWKQLKKYANKKDVKIIGDIPIYVALDSADCWANTKLFQFDKKNMPSGVAGCPPDAFSKTGQLWGNPLYDWKYHENTNFEWWIQRIEYCFKLYDVVRVDHFRGFDEYYTIPYGETTAINGIWKKGPGYKLFEALNQKLGDVDIIAEDLGFLTDRVRQLLKQTGYPGMKVLQFAFDSREDNDYLPHNYDKNCIVYTGTHDNNTILGWYEVISKEDKKFSINYMNNALSKSNEVQWDFIRLAMQSVAKTCIVPIQDYLSLGSEARINTPSTLGGNWKWRLKEDEITDSIIKKIYEMTKIYGRL
ncbi:4-alpha-glucanotransferase [Lachnotalea glycerini]|uniref:4-alpha-glucanotransferase n=1 Tax=Lachnotalea glycerini TaxID=1763509 RepID=A0A371JHE5_9FIRM|nr:4-alpha-glucanotransferase [Lachnotalea glycerini]RDY32150.1 4-alpha-glucanotransferase [Lachnotalea glycerini]